MLKFVIHVSFFSGFAFVTLTSSENISEITWHFNDIVPLSKTIQNEGNIIIFKYKKNSILSLNLRSESDLEDFVDTNIANYLKTSMSDFGENVSENSDLNALPLSLMLSSGIGIAVLLFSKN